MKCETTRRGLFFLLPAVAALAAGCKSLRPAGRWPAVPAKPAPEGMTWCPDDLWADVKVTDDGKWTGMQR